MLGHAACSTTIKLETSPKLAEIAGRIETMLIPKWDGKLTADEIPDAFDSWKNNGRVMVNDKQILVYKYNFLTFINSY